MMLVRQLRLLQRGNVLDVRFIALAHNTIRGAAGGSVLNAELMYAQGMLDPLKEAMTYVSV